MPRVKAYNRTDIESIIDSFGMHDFLDAPADEMVSAVERIAAACFQIELRDETSSIVRKLLIDLKENGEPDYAEDVCTKCDGSGFDGIDEYSNEPQLCMGCRGKGFV